MVKKSFFYAFTIILILLNACEPSYYVPSAVNVPLHTNKGELQAKISTGTSTDFQASYALSNKIAVIGNFMIIKRDSVQYWSDINENTYYDINRFGFDLGGGYYTRFATNGRFEVYSGFGYANNRFYNLKEKTQSIYNAYKFFIQPNVGFTSQFLDMGLGLRMYGINVNSKTDSYNEFLGYMEPVIITRLGYKYVFLTWQMGYSIPTKEQSSAFGFGTNPIFNIGLQIKLWKIYGSESMYKK